jgi:putative flippase GtrA
MSVLAWDGSVRQRAIAREIVLFALVGVLNTGADFGTLNLLVATTHIHQGAALFALNGVGFAVAVIISYVLNTRLTFRQANTANLNQMARFIGVSLVGLLLNGTVVLLTAAWFDGLHAPVLALNAGKLLATGASLCWNYLAMRRFVYQQRHTIAKAQHAMIYINQPAAYGVRVVRPIVRHHPKRR